MTETRMPDGRVVVVGTPIGNLGDLSPRAVAALEGADVVACEDTRRSGRLLQHAGIPGKRLVRLDDHTEAAVTADLVARAAAGDRVALVSDAGLPGLFDLGRGPVAAWSAGVAVEVVPARPFAAAVGPCRQRDAGAVRSVLLRGFSPRKAWRGTGSPLVGEERTMPYEAPHRLRSTMEDLRRDALGADRGVALCRELTKLHEETWRYAGRRRRPVCWEVEPRRRVRRARGGRAAAEASPTTSRVALERELETGVSRRDAAATVAARFDVAPNRVKRLLSG